MMKNRPKNMELLRARAAKARPPRGRKPTCECGECRRCRQRKNSRAYEARNPERKKIAVVYPVPEVTKEIAVCRQPLVSTPLFRFLDRLIASEWRDVPRELLPDEVIDAAIAGTAIPSPSWDIIAAADRTPTMLPRAVKAWIKQRSEVKAR